MCGPIVYGGIVKKWLGQEGELKIAVPDAFFKIVIKQGDDPDRPDVLAFVYPQAHESYTKSGPFDHTPFLKSVDAVEQATGLDFVTLLPDEDEAALESVAAAELWD